MIVLLTSGATLGTHVPALLLSRNLRRAGLECSVQVLETLYRPAVLQRFAEVRARMRTDLRTAVAAQRLIRDQSASLQPDLVADWVARWAAEPVSSVVVLSGLWTPVLERYLAAAPHPPRVEVCHLDVADMPSVRLYGDRLARYGQRRLLERDPARVAWTIPVSTEPPVAWDDRARRVVAHGGGWGIGTYRERAAELTAAGIDLDLVAHDESDLHALPGGSRWHLVDPAWTAWADPGFPSLRPVPPAGGGGSATETDEHPYAKTEEYHDSFALQRRARAIISKPGGGTLLDSLSSATPVVLLEPFGSHESANARCWQELGYGIAFEDWRRSGWADAPLEAAHRRLSAGRASVPDYAEQLVAAESARVPR